MYSEVKTFYIGCIDGKECMDIESFLDSIGKAFKFPDYYGQNLNALWECLNDLDWLNENNYILRVVNYSELLIKNINIRESILESLKSVNREWRNVPNFDGEQEYRKKSDFFIVLD